VTVTGAMLVFRFEPFLLHAEVENMEAATRLLYAARLAGFRESGAIQGSSTSTRLMVGVRCSLRLEVPIADQGQMLVSDDYIRQVCSNNSNRWSFVGRNMGRKAYVRVGVQNSIRYWVYIPYI
jgi:tRNA(Phe) wybutosine-synthesizing methylase Tyw3